MTEQNVAAAMPRPGLVQAMGGLFDSGLWQFLRIVVVVLLALDVGLLFGAPALGIDIMQGFFTLILFPVILAGMFGTLVPRAVRLAGLGLAVGLAAIAASLALALALGIAGHVVAIHWLNGAAFGDEFVRLPVLRVTSALSTIYFVALAGISVIRARNID